jgi:hypothetical protein
MKEIFLTAEQAKKLTEEALAEQNKFEKKHVMKLIKESAEIGLDEVEVPYILDKTVEKWLMDLGYEINVSGNKIYWY